MIVSKCGHHERSGPRKYVSGRRCLYTDWENRRLMLEKLCYILLRTAAMLALVSGLYPCDEKPDSRESMPAETVEKNRSESADGPEEFAHVYEISGSYEYEYDSAGNQIKEIYYNAAGKVVYRYECEYDDAGNLTEEILYDEDGNTVGWYEIEYDDAGNPTKEIFGHAAEDNLVFYWYEYAYDTAGNQVKEVCYMEIDGNVSVYEWYEYEYDTAGNRIVSICYDTGRGVIDWQEYTYDSAGRLTRETQCDENGKTMYWREYIYDDRGRLLREISCRQDGRTEGVEEYLYNEAGLRMTVSYDRYSGIEGWHEYVCDSEGRPIERTDYAVRQSVDD